MQRAPHLRVGFPSLLAQEIVGLQDTQARRGPVLTVLPTLVWCSPSIAGSHSHPSANKVPEGNKGEMFLVVVCS